MDTLARVCTVIACVCLAGMVAVLAATIALRPFGVLVPSSEEITTFLMVGTAFFGMVSAYAGRAHVRVDTLHRRLPAAARYWLDLASHAGGAALCATLAWHSGALAVTAWRFNDVSDGLVAIPMWLPLAAVPLGMGAFAILLLRDGWRVFVGQQIRFALSEREEAAALALDRPEAG